MFQRNILNPISSFIIGFDIFFIFFSPISRHHFRKQNPSISHFSNFDMGSTRFLNRFAKTFCNSYISSSSSSSSRLLQTISLTGGFHRRSIHSDGGGDVIKTHVLVESADENRRNPITMDDVDHQRIEKLCKILSNHSCSSSPLIELSLDHSSVSVVSSEVVEQVLKKLSNAGVLALSFFRWAEKQKGFKPTTEIYHALIESLGKIKQFKLIWILVNSMKVKGLLNKDTFALIERRYARARKIDEAVEAFERMESRYGFKLELSDFNKLLDTLCKSRNVKKAQEVFDEMSKRKKRFTPDLKTYTILLEGWGQEGNMVILKEIFRELKDEGHEPDVVTYGIIINAYCKSRKYDEAMDMFRAMKCKPSPHIYCTLINGLGSDKRLNEAMELFEQSKTIGGFVPEIPTYNAVVGSYCWSARLHDAYRVVDEMRRNGVGPNARTYEIILHHLIKCGRRKEAYSVFQRMGSDGEFGVEPSLNTYTMIIRMLCNEERVDLGVKLWDDMKAKGILPSMALFSTLINSLCVVDNKLDDACKYFEEMLKMGIRPPGQLYNNLKQALLDAGMKDEAVNLGLKLDRIRKTPLVG